MVPPHEQILADPNNDSLYTTERDSAEYQQQNATSAAVNAAQLLESSQLSEADMTHNGPAIDHAPVLSPVRSMALMQEHDHRGSLLASTALNSQSKVSLDSAEQSKTQGQQKWPERANKVAASGRKMLGDGLEGAMIKSVEALFPGAQPKKPQV